MDFHLTLAGAIHAVPAICGIVVGLIRFLRPRRSLRHRARRRGLTYAMLPGDVGSALVTAIGCILINRYRRIAAHETPRDLTETVGTA